MEGLVARPDGRTDGLAVGVSNCEQLDGFCMAVQQVQRAGISLLAMHQEGSRVRRDRLFSAPFYHDIQTSKTVQRASDVFRILFGYLGHSFRFCRVGCEGRESVQPLAAMLSPFYYRVII